MGTALERSESQTDLCLKAASYEIPAWSVDGMDVVAVEESARRATALVREGGGPCFLELRTYRFRAHSMYDPELYREKAEVEEWRARDPITLHSERLREAGLLADDDLTALEGAITAELDRAVAFADAAPVEPLQDLERFVYMERAP